MLLKSLEAKRYRSLRALHLPLGPCTVIVGANGVGKTNVYRAIALAASAAQGTLGRAIAAEGGMQSVVWAGARNQREGTGVEIELSWEAVSYSLALGRPNPRGFGFPTRFVHDPIVTKEEITYRDPASTKKRPIALVERGGASCMITSTEGARVPYAGKLVDSESVLSQIAEPKTYPELAAVRQELLGFRFYHHFRTDPDAAIRAPQVGTRTTVLAHDGADLAAAIVTLEEIGEDDAFHDHVRQAFRGARVEVAGSDEARFTVTMHMPGMARALHASELSDGTLRYLCLLTALLSPRTAPLLVLNEPETSLHPGLLESLAAPVAEAAARTQVIVLTHAHEFAKAVAALTSTSIVPLIQDQGATRCAPGASASEDD